MGKALQSELERYQFLQKTDAQLLEYLAENCDKEGLKKCADKVSLYRKFGEHKKASQLEKKIKELEKKKRLSSKDVNDIFKNQEPNDDDSIVEEIEKTNLD